MKTLVYLGPQGATFTHEAYLKACEYLGTWFGCLPYESAGSNREVIGRIMQGDCYGLLALSTFAQGRITENWEYLISHPMRALHRVEIMALVRLPLTFCLLTNHQGPNRATGVLGHKKSFGACVQFIERLGLPTQEVDSNGEGARLVATDPDYINWACLGPKCASNIYPDLTVRIAGCEDLPATTYFAVFRPTNQVRRECGFENRAIVVCELDNHPGSLCDLLDVFRQSRINMCQIHSAYIGNGTYRFVLELELDQAKAENFREVRRRMHRIPNQLRVFGPYPVI